ncbi:MAG: hypothetical protein HY929_08940 [Euryarchaeota archaeon]|nr:hypothetical protein [Euryarchaeota archaeon]
MSAQKLTPVHQRILNVLEKVDELPLLTISKRLGLNQNYVKKLLDELIQLQLIQAAERSGETYYKLSK